MQGKRDSPLCQSDFLPPSSSGTLSCLERRVHAEGRGEVDTFSFFRKACWELLKMAPIATSPSRFEKPCTSPGPPRWAALRGKTPFLYGDSWANSSAHLSFGSRLLLSRVSLGPDGLGAAVHRYSTSCVCRCSQLWLIYFQHSSETWGERCLQESTVA